jgi:rhodanese-related sulfurtransferase
MMKRYYFILSMFFAFVLVTSSCKKDSTEPLNEAEVLAAYLESADSPYGKDFVNTDMPSIISAEALRTANTAGTVYILDVRSAADYANGHITNAQNVTLANIITHVETNTAAIGTKTIAVVCYTGQTSAFATSLLRLMGYKNAVSLKFGMCSWHSNFDVERWTAKSIVGGSGYVGQFEATAHAKDPKGEMPELSTGKTTGQEILEARLAAILTEGFGPATISAATVFINPANYYIVNYWPEAQYTDPGHIPGAIQYTPKKL